MKWWFSFGLIVLFFIVIFVLLVPSATVITLMSPNYSRDNFFLCQVCHGPGKAAYELKPEIALEELFPMLPKEKLIAEHGRLLGEWKEQVVREGDRVYVAPDGKKWDINFQKWNLSFPEGQKACQQCHGLANIRLNCWQCHGAAQMPKGYGGEK